MNGGTHVAIGAGAGWLTLWGLHSAGVPLKPEVLVGGGIVAAVGAVIPDIDHPRSTVSRRVPRRLVREGLRFVVPLSAVVAVSAALGREEFSDEVLTSGAPLLRLAAMLILPAAILVAVSLLVSRTLGHRGATHSLVFAAGAGLLVAALCARFDVSAWFGVLFGVGWLSHLAADAMTRKGLPQLLWPVPAGSKRR
jgi:membrane-bound metal-dependent hydrolase YbcI (DUF457 family)